MFDSNKTIENFEAVEQAIYDLIILISNNYGLSEDCVCNYIKNYQSNFSSDAWIYHPLFWRAFSKDILGSQQEDLTSELYAHFLDFYDTHVRLYDDALDCLLKLKEDYLLALIANGNGQRLHRLIRKFELSSLFDEIVISGETPYKKPDSFMFNYALKRLECASGEAIMVGDKQSTDIIGAKSCGIPAILLQRNSCSDSDIVLSPESLPDFTAYSLEEVTAIISHIESKGYKPPYQAQKRPTSNAITSALILAGGKGSRLGGLGKVRQKCMLEINGRPLLFYTINTFINAGCKNLVLVVNHLASQIIDYFGDGSAFGASITYIDGEYPSTLDATKAALPYLGDEFYYCHGNIVFPERLLEALWNERSKSNNAVVVVSAQGVSVTHAKLSIDRELVNFISVEPREANSEIFNRTFIGLALYQKDNIEKCTESKMTEAHLIRLLSHGIPISAIDYLGNWWHVETELDYQGVINRHNWEVALNDGAPCRK
jgi:HAD superfamily hydrolase (TIGR01549 family)